MCSARRARSRGSEAAWEHVSWLLDWGSLLLLGGCVLAAMAVDAQISRAASITVEVRDAVTQAPLSGINVELGRRHSAGWSLVRFNSTSAVGTVQFSDLSGGTFTLLLQDFTGAYPWCYSPNAFTRAEATLIVLDDATDYTAVADLSPAGHVAGVVTDEAGAPLENIRIHVGHIVDMQGQGGQGWTAADGSFDIGGLLPAPDWKLYFEDTEHEDYIYQWWDSQRFYEDAAPVPIYGGQTTSVAVTMQKSAHIAGVITTRFGLRCRDVAAEAFRLSESGRWESWSGEGCHEDGSFRIFHLPPGKYIVAFWDTDRPDNKRYYPDTALRSQAKVITLGSGETVNLREVVWNDTWRPTPEAPEAEVVDQGEIADVRMRIKDPRPGGPTADVTIKVQTRGGKLVKTVVLPRRAVNRWLHGRFVADLPRGAYRFSVLATDCGGNRQTRPAVNFLRVR